MNEYLLAITAQRSIEGAGLNIQTHPWSAMRWNLRSSGLPIIIACVVAKPPAL
jgi:hypothetical protein